MKTIFSILIFLTATKIIFSQTLSPEYKSFVKKADSLYKIKNYKNSALVYSSAFKIGDGKVPAWDFYNAACSWSLANNPDSSFYYINLVLKMTTYIDYDKITKDEDLNSLHTDKRWQPILDQLKKNNLPTGWFKAGNKPKSYQMIVEDSSGVDRKKAMTIKSIDKNIDGFGTLMQNFSPDKYLGKRIRMSGYMKSKNVETWSGFWLRVDKAGSQTSLAFDNMQDRPIKGTTEWKKYEIVLDVPSEATNIGFGALLDGTGQIWFDKLNFEIVDKSVPITDKQKEPNLDFSK